MNEMLEVDDGTLACEVHGSGPLVVLAHGIGDSREAYRFLGPSLVAAGYRVAAVDLRGCGASSAEWPSYTRSDIARDLIALVRHLGAPAVLVGHSISGGAATIAAAQAPELVTAMIEIAPFTRSQRFRLRDLRVGPYRRGITHLTLAAALGSGGQWQRYLELAYPGVRPEDWKARLAEILAMLAEPARMRAFRAMAMSSPADAGRQLGAVTCPTLVLQGTDDPDWPSPQAEGQAIVADLADARLVMIEGAGHYPHTQLPEQVFAAIRPFLASVAAPPGGDRA